jgi:Trehalase
MKSAIRPNKMTAALRLLFLLGAASAHTATAELVLSAFTGKINGEGARLDKRLVQHWDDVATTVSWQADFAAGEVEVVVSQAAEAGSAGNLYEVEIAGTKLPGTVMDTGGYETYQEVTLGTIRVAKAGQQQIIVRPLKKGDRGVMNLRSVLLRGPGSEGALQILPPQPGCYFPKKAYVPEALQVFSQVKDRLPEPILPSHPEWQAMYWKCWELAFSHLRAPQPGSPLVSNWLDEAFSPNIFQWDTCFMMMFARYGHAEFPAIQSLDNFYALQRPSGFICREYDEAGGGEIHFGHNGGLSDPTGWKNTINPPIFAWAETENYKVTGDKSRFAAILPVLEKYVEWLNRDGDPGDLDVDRSGRKSKGTPHGLYWNTPLGSGLDNTPKPTEKGCGWVDMSCQMVMQYNDIATIARELGQPEKAKVALAEAKAISDRINRWCWDEKDGFYYDVDAAGKKFRKKTACGFWPMIAGVASEQQAARLVEHLKDPKEFNRPFLFPTLSADEKEYRPDGGYWLGGVWAPSNYVIIKGLERYGHEAFAAEATEKYLAAMNEVFKKTGTVWENYAPESMKEGNPSRGDFVGWTGCGPIALYIENVLGFRPDGARRTLLWNLRLAEPHGIRRLQFGSVSADLFHDGKETVTTRSNEPFTLTVRGKNHAIPAGEHILKIPLTGSR